MVTMKDENASSPSLAEGKNQEVFITDAERIKAIKSALWDIVELYDDAKLSSSERRSKCIDRIGEIEIHKRANSELFTDREVEFLEKVQMEDSTLMHTSFHAAALHGIFDSDDRNSQAWNISIIRGKLAYFEDLSEMIDVYVENPS